MRGGSSDVTAARTTAARTTAVAVAVAVLSFAAGCGRGGGDSDSAPSTSGPTAATSIPQSSATVGITIDEIDGSAEAVTTSSIRIAPLTPRDPNRITEVDRAAIAAIAESGAFDPPDAHGHSHGASSFMPLLTGDAATFANQWLAAQRSTDRFDRLDEIKALGYVRSSAPIAGIGSHWVLWPQLAKPFDPSNPTMVLFDESKQPAQLVGFSYWLQSPTRPEGFAGPNDHWHQHQGLCVVNGWVDRERATGPDVCAGAYFPGGDLWMLHAWPVGRYPNRDGNFATVNPTLCPGNGVPDIARCADE